MLTSQKLIEAYGDFPMNILLGDLRHSTVGRHSVVMPLALGSLASYAKAKLGTDVLNITIEDDPGRILDLIERRRPDVLGLSNYVWNSEISRLVFSQAKSKDPSIVCVAGGPEFPTNDHEDCWEYLKARPQIDFYIYHEGEVSFATLLERIHAGANLARLKGETMPGIMSVSPESGKLVAGPPRPRLDDLDVIPSPYLNGIFDEYFPGKYIPFIETARGCPFHCAYCSAGSDWYNKVATFSIERVKQDLAYIAERVEQYSDLPLAIADSNFGLFKRDTEIADYIRQLQDRYNWPLNFAYVSTGKMNFDRLFYIANTLQKRLPISLSVQSMNRATLDAVGRKNVDLTIYENAHRRLASHDIGTYCDLIIPLPLETKQTFMDGLRELSRWGIKRFIPSTTMMLKDTLLASREFRDKFGSTTRFRILPRQFGEYCGQKCFEIEEVCVATDTMPLEDYIECRGLAFISRLFSDWQFDTLQRHCDSLGVDYFEWINRLWLQIKTGSTPLSEVYAHYVIKTKTELFDSPEQIYEYFTKDENYQALLRGDIGDNLLRKYLAKALIKCNHEAIDLAHTTLVDLIGDRGDTKVLASIQATLLWVQAVRNITPVLNLNDDAFEEIYLDMDYDVDAWYRAGSNSRPLIAYEGAVRYRLTLDRAKLTQIINHAKTMYGEDINFWFLRILDFRPTKDFWRQCEIVSK